MKRRNFDLTVIVGGTFDAPMKLSALLDADSPLNIRCISSTPRFKWQRNIISRINFTFVPKLSQVYGKLFRRTVPRIIRYYDTLMFSKIASSRCKNSGLLFGYQGHFLEAALANKESISVLDRACPHILKQEDLFKRSCADLKIKYLDPPKWWMQRCIEEYKVSDKIVVPSEFTRQSFLDCDSKLGEKLHMLPIPCKFPVSKFQRTFPKKFTVLFIGGALERKGLIYLLMAWRSVGFKDAELLVKISKSDIQRSSEIKKYISAPNIRILGSYSDIREFYKLGSVFCFPSTDDGFGMAAVEAMAAGLPVITTRNCGASQYVEEGRNGFVLEPFDSDAIAEKLVWFYENQSCLLEMGRHGQNICQTQLGYDQYVKKFLSVLGF